MGKYYKAIISLFFLLVFSGDAVSLSPTFLHAVSSGSTSCDTSQQSQTDATVTPTHVAKFSSSTYRSSKFTYSGTTSKAICRVDLKLQFVGSNTHTYGVKIYSDSAGDPNSAIGTSDSKDLSSIGSSEVTVQFDFSTPTSALTNGNVYHVVLYSATADADDYAEWYPYDYSGTPGAYNNYSGDGISWSAGTANFGRKFEIFSQ